MTSFDNRRWMYKKFESDNVVSQDWVNNVLRFVEICASNPLVEKNDKGMMRCPCVKCKNQKFASDNTILEHILRKGFTPNYKEWVCHEEKHGEYVPPKRRRVDVDTATGMGAYVDMIYDAAGPSFAELEVDEEPNPQDKKIFDMLKAADTDLWQGCKKMSQLSTTARLLNIKSDHNLSERCYDTICQLVKDVLPEENSMVDSFYKTKKLIDGLGLPVLKIHCCVLGCMLFWGPDESLAACKICEKPRFKDGNAKIPHRQMFYFPLTPRLKRLYMSKRTANPMQWHAKHVHEDTDELCHPSDSETWRTFDTSHPSFASEVRNVRLALCTDGFQPFGQSGSQYSCWPVMVTPLNLPPNMCMKEESIFLSCIVPGRSNPKQRIDVYLQPLIAELKQLWDDGVETFDVSKKQNFIMRVALMWTIGDFPAYSMMSGWSTAGKIACPVCMDQVKSFRLQNGGK